MSPFYRNFDTMAKTATKAVKKTAKKPRKKSSRAPQIGNYLGLDYESSCEKALLYFAEELKKEGYVDRVERSPSYLLCDAISTTYVEQLKRGSKSVEQNIQQGVSYTPDYDIYFTEKAIGKFCWLMGSTVKYDRHLLVAQNVGNLYRACCEVKPDFSRASTTPKSMQSMKWLYQRHKIFANLFRPNDIFEKLFTPEKYKITESGVVKQLKYKVRNLQTYLKTFVKDKKK